MNPIDVARDEREVRRTTGTQRWSDLPTGDLVDHVVTAYHDRLRRDVPRLIDAARKLETLHPNAPRDLTHVLTSFWNEMQTHMMKEEEVLFPMLRAGRQGLVVIRPVHMMVYEHDVHTEHLERIRSIVTDFIPPAYADDAWIALYRDLHALDGAMREHINFENDILFPRVE